MDKGKRRNAIIFREIGGTGRGLLPGLVMFLLLGYLFACARALRFLHPAAALFQFTPLYTFELVAASVGATYGLQRFVKRKNKAQSDGKRSRKMVLCFLFCFFVAFLLECTLFQYHHYGALKSSGQISTRDAETDWSTLRFGMLSLDSGDDNTERFYFSLAGILDGTESAERQEFIERTLSVPPNSKDEEYKQGLSEFLDRVEEYGIEEAYPKYVTYEDELAVVSFSNINRNIHSVHISPFFLLDGNKLTGEKIHSMKVSVLYSDEDNTLQQSATFTIVDGLEYTEYIPLYSVGEATNIDLCFGTRGSAFTEISLNEMIPLTPVLPRMILVSIILFFGYALLIYKYELLIVRFDKNSHRQNIGFAILLAFIFVYCSILSANYISFPYEEGSAGQYNKYLVDALMEGRVNLDIPTSPEYAAINRPYDRGYFYNLYGLDYLGEKIHWDAVYYNNSWYSYFGVVPAVILFLPFTALTGTYLPYPAACLLFGYLAIVFLLLIWRWFFIKVLNHTSYFVYLITSLALAMCSFVPFLIRRSFFYETVNLAGLMFCSAGLLLLFYYKEKRKTMLLSASCLCFALSVGCRPILVLCSILVPVCLWSELKKRWMEGKVRFTGLLLTIIVPYIIIAIPLMWYNYVRFGSVAEFGLSYQVTALNIGVQDKLNPVGKLYRALAGIKGYLFNPPSVTEEFPFITSALVKMDNGVHIAQYLGAVGIAWIPIVWLHFLLLGKRSKRIKHRSIVRFNTAAILLCVVMAALSATYCIQPRYEIDYAWLALLSGMSCIVFAYERCDGTEHELRGVERKISIVCILSIIMFFFLNFRGEVYIDGFQRPLAFDYYMRRVFSFFNGI